MSSDVSQSLKGLANDPGENNCFLNSTIQILWHLPLFRSSLSSLYGHYCMQEKCVFCAFKTLFIQLEKVKKPAIPPGVLRQAMAGAFYNESRFQLGQMDDAAECYEHILSRLHFHLTRNCSEDCCQSPHCITHAKFSTTLFEQSCCGCGEQSEPLGYSQVIQYVSASAFVSTLILHEKNRLSFGKCVHLAIQSGDARVCGGNSGKCKEVSTTKRYLMNNPSVFCIGVVWNSNSIPLQEIMMFVNALEPTITIEHLFDKAMDRESHGKQLNLVGMVMYYGLHYSSLFLSKSSKKWTYFDDSKVRVIGDNLEAVKALCQRGHYQPLLLVYEDPTGTPVDCEGAPATVMPMDRQQEMETLKTIASPFTRSMSKKQSLSAASSPIAPALKPEVEVPAKVSELPEVVHDLIEFSLTPSTVAASSAVQRSPPVAAVRPRPRSASPSQQVDVSMTGSAATSDAVPTARPRANPSAMLQQQTLNSGIAAAASTGASPPRARQQHGAFNAEQRREMQQMRDRLKSGRVAEAATAATEPSAAQPLASDPEKSVNLIDFHSDGGYKRISEQVLKHSGSAQLTQSAATAPGLYVGSNAIPLPSSVQDRRFGFASSRNNSSASSGSFDSASSLGHAQSSVARSNTAQPQVTAAVSRQTPAVVVATASGRTNSPPVSASSVAPVGLSNPVQQVSSSSQASQPIAGGVAGLHRASDSSQGGPAAGTVSRAPPPRSNWSSSPPLRDAKTAVSAHDVSTGSAGNAVSAREPQLSVASASNTRKSSAPSTGAAPSAPYAPTAPASQSVDRIELVDQYCAQADDLMLRAAEKDSEGRLAEAVECLKEASRIIETAAKSAKFDQALQLSVHRQAALISRARDSQERRLLSTRHASRAGRVERSAGRQPSVGNEKAPVAAGRNLSPSADGRQPVTAAAAVVQGAEGTDQTDGGPPTSERLKLPIPPAGTYLSQTPSPTPASVDNFMASLGDTSLFNTRPENHSDAYRLFHRAPATYGWQHG